MAEKSAKPAPAGFHDKFGWFIWGFVALAFLWFFTGGTQKESSHEGAYLKPLAPLDSGEVYGNYYQGSQSAGKTKLDVPEDPMIFIRKVITGVGSIFTTSSKTDTQTPSFPSLFSKKVYFDGVAGAKNSEPSEEYVRIVTNKSAHDPVTISGFGLYSNRLDKTSTIPRAVELLTLGVTAIKSEVHLPPNGRALITSSRSPVGSSFRVNMCTGYLEQFQTYTPSLRLECPEPITELERVGPINEAACVDFVKKIPRCEIYKGTLPSTLSAACKAFVTEKLTYNTCALDHKNDTGFYKDEWRLFLDSTNELWKNSGEIIRLVDDAGKTVDSLSY